MNADEARAGGKKALVGTTLVVGIGQSDPQENLAPLYRFLQITCVSGHEPRGQSVFQAPRTRTEAIDKAVCERTGRTAKKLGVIGKRQLLNDHRLLWRCHDRPPSKDALEGKAAAAVEKQPTRAQISERMAQLLP
jgi:hypothetical protein